MSELTQLCTSNSDSQELKGNRLSYHFLADRASGLIYILLACLAFQLASKMGNMTTSQERTYFSSTKAVFVELNMNSIKKPNPRRRKVDVNSMANALEVLTAASEDDTAYKFKRKKGKFGSFITCINGIEQIPDENMFWMFYVNGKEEDEGVSSYIPKENDTITFKFEKVSNENKVLLMKKQ